MPRVSDPRSLTPRHRSGRREGSWYQSDSDVETQDDPKWMQWPDEVRGALDVKHWEGVELERPLVVATLQRNRCPDSRNRQAYR